jgi:signal transduction histidine kinase
MSKRRDARAELLLAVAHEVGNLLAAMRLSAHLLPHAAEPRERARSAREIEQLAAQAGELLAQVRPLVAGTRGRAAAVSPAEVLEGVRRALSDAPGAERLAVRPAPRGLPDVRIVDPDALLHALLALVRGALEASRDHGPVELRARRSGKGVAFEIADAAPAPASARPGSLPRGRALAVKLADAALRPGGRAEARPRRGGLQVAVTVPSAPARPRGRRAV